VHGTTFYHKGPLPKDIPAAVRQLKIPKREATKARGYGLRTLMACSASSRSAPLNYIREMRQSKISSRRTSS
jgi:hypothetical protein